MRDLASLARALMPIVERASTAIMQIYDGAFAVQRKDDNSPLTLADLESQRVIIEGLKATRALSNRGIKVNVTLVFSPLQGLAAAKCGATYLSPFVGRLDDIGHDGIATVEQLVRILRNYGYPTQVLVASIRTPAHLLRAAEMGAHVATLPFNVMTQMLHHPLTDVGLEKFLADWRATKQKI